MIYQVFLRFYGIIICRIVIIITKSLSFFLLSVVDLISLILFIKHCHNKLREKNPTENDVKQTYFRTNKNHEPKA